MRLTAGPVPKAVALPDADVAVAGAVAGAMGVVTLVAVGIAVAILTTLIRAGAATRRRATVR